jgi:hypothetical protein
MKIVLEVPRVPKISSIPHLMLLREGNPRILNPRQGLNMYLKANYLSMKCF